MSGSGSPRRSCQAWARKTPQIGRGVAAVVLARARRAGTSARVGAVPRLGAGLSAATITRLTAAWQDEAAAFANATCRGRGLRLPVGRRYPCQRPPGGRHRLCLLVMIGVRADGTQGTDRADRRLPRVDRVVGGSAARLCPPRDARSGTGDRRWRVGVLGGRCGRCSPRPVSSGAGSTSQLQCSCRAAEVGAPGREERRSRRSTTPRTSDHALEAVKAFEAAYGAKWPKAVAKITDDIDVLLAFYDYPAEHWVHLRTTNPIVISSSREGVHDVRHAVTESPVLRGGRGYLQSSRMQSLRRDDASCAGFFT